MLDVVWSWEVIKFNIKLSLGNIKSWLGNADEVGEVNHKDNSLGKHGEDPGLLWLLGIGVCWDITHAGVEWIFLVDADEVDGIPDSNEGSWDQI